MSVELFKSIGLSHQKAEETLRNTSLSQVLKDIIDLVSNFHIFKTDF